MGLKEQIEWVKSEWGIFADGQEMDLRKSAQWLRQWGPVGARTIGYGAVSVALGPLTKNHEASLWAMRNWCRSSLTGLRIVAEIEGAETVPDEPVVYAANHQSLLDILVLGATLPGDFKWAAKSSLMKIPFLGWHLKLSGHVPVDRKRGRRAAAETIERFTHVLQNGKRLLIFPEGTRSEDGILKPFKNGGFYAALGANCAVIPVALDGTHRLMSKSDVDTGSSMHTRQQLTDRVVKVRVGAPIRPAAEGSRKERVGDLRARAQQAVADMLAQMQATEDLA